MNSKICYILLCFIAGATAIYGAEMQAEHKIVTVDSIQWTDAKGLPTARMAVITGDPSKEGLFTIRLSAPAGLKVLPHWHPTDEHVTVLSGALYMGMGDKFDPSNGNAVPAGGYSFMPAKMHHYAWFKDESIIQITGMGPWQIIYLNPEDDPSKPKK